MSQVVSNPMTDLWYQCNGVDLPYRQLPCAVIDVDGEIWLKTYSFGSAIYRLGDKELPAHLLEEVYGACVPLITDPKYLEQELN